jgi:hypothetical protein
MKLTDACVCPLKINKIKLKRNIGQLCQPKAMGLLALPKSRPGLLKSRIDVGAGGQMEKESIWQRLIVHQCVNKNRKWVDHGDATKLDQWVKLLEKTLVSTWDLLP